MIIERGKKRKYAFNLGRVFTLSLAELFAVFEKMGLAFKMVALYREVLIIETETELEVAKLQKDLGGTIKIMEVLDSLGRKKFLRPSQIFKNYFDAKHLADKYLPATSGKTVIGISLYPLSKGLPPLRDENKRIGMEIKNLLRVAGVSARMVFPQKLALALPSVVVTKENLLTRGAEIDFFVGSEEIFLGKTLTVQDFEDYGRRDYQRPLRDMRVGLLPPKVAQIMINLAQIPGSVKTDQKQAMLDPFVGSGTIIQEAIIQGYRAVGSDISEKQVTDAETNLEWIRNRYSLPRGRFEMVRADAAELPKGLPKYDYLAIITEGTLGPVYSELPNKAEIAKNFKELEPIYISAFEAFKKILKSGSRVVVALPAYRTGDKKYEFFPVVDKITKLGYNIISPVPEVLLERFDFLEVTARKSIIYDRKDQFVSREIFIFEIAD